MLSTDIYQRIPEELRRMDNWVVWRYEERNGGRTKVPYQVNGNRARSNDPTTWTTFGNAVAAADVFDGIGWCAPLGAASEYYWGLDIDDSIDPTTGELREWEGAPVQPNEFLKINSYAEKTPSGAGFRVIVKCTRPVLDGQKKIEFGQRNPATGKTPGVEMYCSGRFFTFTGDMMMGSRSVIEDRTDEVLALHERVFSSRRTKEVTKPIATSSSRRPSDLKDRLASEMIEGRIPNSSRNNLTVGIMDVLASKGWAREDIEGIVGLLIAYFNSEDPAYDIAGTLQKQKRELDRIYDRLAKSELVFGYKWLEETLTPSTVGRVRSLVVETKDTSKVQSTLNLIRQQPPESFAHQDIKYLVEPEVPKGALVLITGKPGHGKSTLVMQWCIQADPGGQRSLIPGP
jgi:hypothetical protein